MSLIQRLFVVLCLSVVVYAQVTPTTTGLAISIFESGWQEIISDTQPYLTETLKATPIPDQSGSTGTPIGTIDYQLTGITIDSLNLGKISIQDVTNGISAGSQGASGHISLDWHYSNHGFIHVSDHGSADITFDLSISASASITDNNGVPKFGVLSSNADLSNLQIQLHGGASWLYQIFVNIFAGEIQKAASEAINQALVQAISVQANQAVATAPLFIKLDPNCDLDYAMTQNPVFNPQYLTSYHAGEFIQVKKPDVSCPCSHSPLPSSVNSDMIQFFFGDYVANCAGWAYTEAGALTSTLNQSTSRSIDEFGF